jgi:hypothetical protein
MLSSIMIFIGFPVTKEFSAEEEDDEFDDAEQEYGTETEVSICKLMGDPRFIMAAFGSSLSYF